MARVPHVAACPPVHQHDPAVLVHASATRQSVRLASRPSLSSFFVRDTHTSRGVSLDHARPHDGDNYFCIDSPRLSCASHGCIGSTSRFVGVTRRSLLVENHDAEEKLPRNIATDARLASRLLASLSPGLCSSRDAETDQSPSSVKRKQSTVTRLFLRSASCELCRPGFTCFARASDVAPSQSYRCVYIISEPLQVTFCISCLWCEHARRCAMRRESRRGNCTRVREAFVCTALCIYSTIVKID